MIKKADIKFVIILFIVFFPYFFPDYFFRIYPYLSTVFKIWRLMSFCLISFIVIREKKITNNLLFFSFFNLLLLFLTFINSGNISQCSVIVVGILTLTLGVHYGQKNTKLLLRFLEFMFFLPILLNFFSILFYPNGLYYTDTTNRNWLLGYDNTHIQYFLPSLMVSLINIKIKNNGFIFSLLNILIILLSVLICKSTTTLVGVSIVVLLNIVPWFKKHSNIFNFKNYVILSFVLFFLIVIFRFQNMFEFFIVDILGKDLTFTNRTFLWDITLDYFYKKPFLGYGWQSYELRNFMYNNPSAVFAHNQYLEWLFLGGLLYIFSYILICMYINRISKNLKNNSIIFLIHSCFLVLLVLWLTECYLHPIIYLVFIFSVYSLEFSFFDKEEKV